MKSGEKKTKKRTGDMGINIDLWIQVRTIVMKRGITNTEAAEEAFEAWVKRNSSELAGIEPESRHSRKDRTA